ncbi:DsbA family protein [Chitinimonas koreensis]|uniref:DsbA family protein n=1 Tax=Chitinimonas koreensis TaxID=356302 RepID=UPI000420F8E6|nr:DsbA family protein [Chitinimonas koreensis]QNM97740.1 DsbA family protein [Chitinimonas koreensis]
MQAKLTLLFDPLCGWCYGAQPALAALDAALSPDWTLLPTGLFARPQAMSAERADYFWRNDRRIAEMTGQPFSAAYRERVLADLETPFDSTLATQAWLLIEAARPDAALAALHRIQALRYLDGLPHTPATLAEAAAEFGLDAADFRQRLAAGWPAGAQARLDAARDLMQRHRLQGVPALLAGERVVPGQYLYQPQTLIDHIATLVA